MESTIGEDPLKPSLERRKYENAKTNNQPMIPLIKPHKLIIRILIGSIFGGPRYSSSVVTSLVSRYQGLLF